MNGKLPSLDLHTRPLRDQLADAVQKTQSMAGADVDHEAHRQFFAAPQMLLRVPPGQGEDKDEKLRVTEEIRRGL